MRQLIVLLFLGAFGVACAKPAELGHHFDHRFDHAMQKAQAFHVPAIKNYQLSNTIIVPEKKKVRFDGLKHCRKFSVQGLKTWQGKKVVSVSKGYVCEQKGQWRIKQLPTMVVQR